MPQDPTSMIAAMNAALAGRYRVEEEIGAGGMARVYGAEDLRHNRPVAIKVLRREVAAEVGAERFLQEIGIAARLQHPHILPLLDSGEVDGRVFYVMPQVDGPSLRERLDQEGELPVGEAVRLLIEVADALAHAHAHGVVHRDVKPDNVMVSGRHALVADFGVARALEADEDGHRVTTVGRAIGTPTYMAPEQAAADPHVDHRADIYALGVLAFELLTGEPPFTGATHQAVLAAQVTQPPPRPSERRPGIGRELEEVVLRCLAKRPADRWQSADEVRERLEPLATPGAGSTPVSQPRVRLSRISGRRRVVAAAAFAAVVVAVVALGWTAVQRMLGGGDALLTIGEARRLTTETGLETHAAISPDGRFVAYAAGPATHMRIYIRPVTGDRTISLTEGGTELEFAPRWSPDGSRILFLTVDGVHLASALGGSARRVAGAADIAGPFSSHGGALMDIAVNGAAWSPDGRRIFLARGGQLSLLDLDTDTETPLATLEFELHSCDWSPLGDWVACTSGNLEAIVPSHTYGNIAPSAVILVHAEDGRVVEVTERSVVNESPAWSPDGTRLYFVSNRHGPRDVYAVAIGRDGRPEGEPERITTGLEAQSIDLSADGQRLAYATYTSRANIWSVPIPSDEAPVDATSGTRLTSENQIVEAMTVTRDGRWLLYDSNLHGSADVYRMPVDGGPSERLTHHPSDDFAPDLSPDGRWVVFHSWRTGTRDIFIKPVSGGATEQLTGSRFQESYPVWSPRGDAIAFYDQWREGGESRGVFLIRREDNGEWGEPTLLRRGGSQTTWAPDGSFLVHAVGSGIEMLPLGAGEPRVVYEARPGSDDPVPGRAVVAADGQTLYFKSHDEQDRASLWSVPVTGGQPRLLVRFDDPARPSIRSDFAAGAGRFFFTIEDRQSDIWVAEMAPAR